MKKKIPVLVLIAALICTIALSAMAVETAPVSDSSSGTEPQPLPDSVLYYGTIEEIKQEENGTISRLHMTSEQYGEYILNVSEQTAWIDSGNHSAADPADVKEGDRVYVFHSAIATKSLPPMSNAFAVVSNIPMDVGCAQYHVIEDVSSEQGCTMITTDNGSLRIVVDQDTVLSFYGEDTVPAMEDIHSGNAIMAWYGSETEDAPGQVHADYLMLLPEKS